MGKKIARGTVKISMITLGVLAAIAGLAQVGGAWDFSGYVWSIIGFAIFLSLASELGLKKKLRSFKLKEFGTMQIISSIVAVAVFLNAVFALPFIARSIPVLSDFAGVFYFLGGIFLILEAFVDSD